MGTSCRTCPTALRAALDPTGDTRNTAAIRGRQETGLRPEPLKTVANNPPTAY